MKSLTKLIIVKWKNRLYMECYYEMQMESYLSDVFYDLLFVYLPEYNQI